MSGDEPPEGEGPNVLSKVLSTVTPNFIRRSFAIKFGLVLLVMGASIGIIGLFATEQISAETQQNVEDEYRGVASQESDIINEWLQRNELSTRLSSASDVWSNGTAQELSLALQTQKSGLGADVFEMHLVDRGIDTQVVATSGNSLSAGDTLGDTARSWFTSLRVSGQLGQLKVNEIYVHNTYEVGPEPVVGFVSPVGGREGRFLLVEVSLDNLRESLQGAERAAGGFTQVVAVNSTDYAQSTVIIDETGDDTLDPYAQSQSALEPLQALEDLRDQTGRQATIFPDQPADPDVIDEEYTVGVSPVEDTEWAVLVHAPRSSVFGFVQTISDFGLFATIGMILMIGAFGTILGYSTSSSIDRLTGKTEEMREGDLDVTFYTSRIDNIGRLYEGFAEMRDALQQQIEEAERARKEAEVSRAEAMEMSNYLQEKAEEYSQIMQQCAAGDLTQRMDQDGENESMDQIADEFNEMIGELEKTTGQLKSYVDEVEAAGAEVEQSATTVRQASEQVADSIQTISDDAYDQKERLQDISETMDGVAGQIEDLAAEHPDIDFDTSLDEINTVASKLEETADLSESTMAEAENVAGAAEEQAAELNEVSERAHDLQRYAQPLRDILNRFETEAEHEFVFSVGPTGGGTGSTTDEDEEE